MGTYYPLVMSEFSVFEQYPLLAVLNSSGDILKINSYFDLNITNLDLSVRTQEAWEVCF